MSIGFDFIMIVPLLLLGCIFSFVLGCGVSFFLMGFSVFLSMVVQQLVVIWGALAEDERTFFSTIFNKSLLVMASCFSLEVKYLLLADSSLFCQWFFSS